MLRSRSASKLLLPRISAQKARADHGCVLFSSTSHRAQQIRNAHSSSQSSTLQQQREQEGLTMRQHKYVPPVVEEIEPAYVARTTRRAQRERNKASLQRESQQGNQAFQIFQQAQTKTQELLQIPRGKFAETDWRTAHDLLNYWCTTGIYNRNPSRAPRKLPQPAIRESVDQSFALLDKLVEEQQSKTNNNVSISKAILQPSLLETVLRNWKQVCRRSRSPYPNFKQQEPTKLTPSKALSKLHDITVKSTSLSLNVRLYNMIMDVAIKQGIRESKPQKDPKDATGYSAIQATPEMLETAEFVESLLETMLKDSRVKPDSVTYATVIQAWSLVGDGARAQHWLQHVCDSYQQQESNIIDKNEGLVRPHRKMFHTVLEAYARGPKRTETMEQCYGLVRQMQELHDTSGGGLETAPNIQTYNIVLSCLANNPLIEDSVLQAEKLFHNGMAELRDVKSYNTLLDMYAKRRMAAKAEALLEQMYEECQKNRDRLIEPNTKSFNIVLSAWSKAGETGAVERLFALMEELHASKALRKVAPDFFTYSIVLESWAQQVGKLPGARDRAEAILYTMKRLGNAGNDSLRPTAVTYSILLKALAKAGDAERAEQVLGEMMDEVLQRNDERVLPDLTAFNTVLLALSRSDQHDAVSRIQALMARMEELSNEGPFGNLRPDTRSWNSLLQAVARSGRRGAGAECEKILKNMEALNVEVNTISYATSIQAFARAGKAEDAERLLQMICDSYYKQTNTDDSTIRKPVKPSVQLFTSVMTAWSKKGTPEALTKAEKLLQQMKDLSLAGDLEGVIDTICYNALLDSWSGSSRQDVGERIDAIMHEMEGTAITKPNTVSYNTALNAFARVGDAERCQELFERMVDESKTNSSRVQPDFHTLTTLLKAWSNSSNITNEDDRASLVFDKLQEITTKTGINANVACYNVVLDCLARAQKKEAMHLAEELLCEMELPGTREHENIKPGSSAQTDTVSYSTVINGYGNLGNAEKAEVILERMIEEYVRRGKNRSLLMPNVRCFNSALAAWSKKAKHQSSPDAPARAEAILDRMRSLSKTTGLPVQPNVVSYNIVLDCWGNSGLECAGTRAEGILKQMLESENEDIAPDTRSYNTVMAAFARTGNFKKAEALLQTMHDSYNRKTMLGEHSPAKPDIVTWNTLLTAYAKSRSPVALDKAEYTLRRMGERYNSGHLEVKANTISFNNLLNCVVKANRNDAGERCEAIVAEMDAMAQAGEKHLKPTAMSYRQVVRAWVNRHNCERAQTILLQLCDAYENGDKTMKPTIDTFRLVLKCISDRGDRGMEGAAAQIREQTKRIYPSMLDVEHCTRNNGSTITAVEEE